MSGRGGHLLLLWKSPSVEHIPVCSAVSLIPVGDTKSSTSNCTASFQIGQTGSDSEGLVLLSIATGQVTAICSKPACPVAARQGHLRRGRPVSTFIDTVMRDAGAASTSELSACKENKVDWAAHGD